MEARSSRSLLRSDPSASGARLDGNSQRGLSIVELGLAMPLMMVVMLGTVDLGRGMVAALCVTGAATAGAQYGARTTGATTDVLGMAAAAKASAPGSAIDATARSFCECPGNVPDDCLNSNCPDDYSPELYVEVTASTTFQTMFPWPGIPAVLPIRRTVVKRVQ